jgi:hypothetical protein
MARPDRREQSEEICAFPFTLSPILKPTYFLRNTLAFSR